LLDSLIQQLNDYTVILKPDENKAEWWAGAPSVARGADGTFFLAARMRNDESPKGRRGYETRILQSADGVHFEEAARLRRDDVGVPGFERPALRRDPNTGKFKLYSCTDYGKGWRILKFDDAEHPAEFDPCSARTVLSVETPDDDLIRLRGYKDPVLYHDGKQWHLFVIGIDRVERVHHFLSADGEAWRPGLAAPVMENQGWHNCFTRPAAVLPMAVGWLFIYEGSHFEWHDPNYNIATGLAYTPDLQNFHDLTPDNPLITSDTPSAVHTWRYSDWLVVDEKVHVYFEAACANGTNEIRMARVAMPAGAF
jgi:hypothetical protein